jgi:two-component system, NarL family, invasion response regulator UvrY
MIRILLADDHTLFREGLKQILSRHADLHVADEAGNGADTLRLAREGRYDLLVLDISMPGPSGWEVLHELRRLDHAPAVLVLSMHPEDQYAVRMLRAGAAGYISKESAADELITAIRRVASGGRYVSSAVAEQLAMAASRDLAAHPHEQLSNREFQVMERLVAGKPVKDIADELCLSEKTVTTYRARILEKLGVKNNVELARYALDHRLLK